MQGIEQITAEGRLLALIVRRDVPVEQTTFLTDPGLNLQAGLIVYPGGSHIERHTHHPIERTTEGTSEAVLVREGRCTVDIFTDDHEPVSSHELRVGDLVLLVAGGHGFQVLEDTVLLEIKQGPYPGLAEKERF